MSEPKDYFQLRIPRNLKKFYDEYAEKCKPIGITSGNDMMRFILISKANELKNELEGRDQIESKSSK